VPVIFKGPGFYTTDNRAKNSAGEGNHEEKKEVAKEASKEPANKKVGDGSE
jgi:predicted nucleic acid-binding Zn ribbon protein